MVKAISKGLWRNLLRAVMRNVMCFSVKNKTRFDQEVVKQNGERGLAHFDRETKGTVK
jgi:hypothetical protein